ncbi:hypothetical protein GF339_04690 [candidate division KSB3 bacterium]|uniref:DegT/DnrJ/EryC1/StrS aminotransferase n=1 Tax=candidate division KSB3 bacterium TaxID=2044937 RepID=A0A9D5JTV3_9BACT|nr:hypothetical protein [candidate division KSB3 bacterium]
MHSISTMIPEYFPDQGHLFYFWKGRVALYTILNAFHIGPGDEVILPGFTCVVVANAILYLGATPVYADIEPETYNLSVRTIEPLITSRTRVILAQNTFGLSADLDPILALANHHGLVVVEDCAHGLGGSYKNRPNGTVAHAAFFSTQWSKPISTGLGGIAYIQDEACAEQIEHLIRMIPPPTFPQQLMLSAQRILRPFADHPLLHYALIRCYRVLTQKFGFPVGSSTGQELTSIKKPPGYLKRMGRAQLRLWQRSLVPLAKIVKQRQQAAAIYDAYFDAIGLALPRRPAYADHAMLRYPIRVANKPEILTKAQHFHIPLGDWFVSPLHPVGSDLQPWRYQQGQCPIAERACREVVNLFTDSPLSRRQLDRLFSK